MIAEKKLASVDNSTSHFYFLGKKDAPKQAVFLLVKLKKNN